MALIRGVITDIEGTTSSLSILKELLAPYAREHLRSYVTSQRDRGEVREALRATRELAREPEADEARTLAILTRWIDEDRKAPPLKLLQGLIWERGYRDGTLRAHVYEDVAPVLRSFQRAGLKLYVYSSGSVLAQQLFFEHTREGDLRELFTGYFDTNVGAKGEAESYRSIARAIGLEPATLLFLSDAQAELDAAESAGLHVLGVAREGNPPLRDHALITSFDELALDVSVRKRDVTEPEASRALVTLVRAAHARGWAPATSGNFSVRTKPERVLITASGRDKGTLTERDLVAVDLRGRPLDPRARPSAETPLHCSLYRRRPEIGAVAHTHSLAGTLLSRRYLERGVLRLGGYELAKACHDVLSHEQELILPVVANSQDMQALECTLDEALARHEGAHAYLVAGHGLTTWASDLQTLSRQLEALEFLLACTLAQEQLR